MFCVTGEPGEMGSSDQSPSVVQEGVGTTHVTAHQSQHAGGLQQHRLRGGNCHQTHRFINSNTD